MRETIGRLQDAGLSLRSAPTKTGNMALVADNVEVIPRGLVAKRPGYRRFLDVREAHPVTGLLGTENLLLVMAGDLDELAT